MTLGRFGQSIDVLGEVRRAIDVYEQALAIRREIGDPRGEGTALANLGESYQALGDMRRAVGYCEDGVQIADAIGLAQGSSEGRVILATSYLHAGEFALARTTAEAAQVTTKR